MLWGLLRYLDPIAHRKRQEDLRRQREDWPPDLDPGLWPDDTDAEKPPESLKHKTCRICGYQGPDPRFCPTCLAETMQ